MRRLPSWAGRSAWLQVATPGRGQGDAYVDDVKTDHASLEDASATAQELSVAADEASLAFRDGETKSAVLLGGGHEGRARLSGQVDAEWGQLPAQPTAGATREAFDAMAARLGALWPQVQGKVLPRVLQYPYGGTVLDQDGTMAGALQHVRQSCGQAFGAFLGGGGPAPLPLLLANIDLKAATSGLWGASALLVRHPPPRLRSRGRDFAFGIWSPAPPADAGQQLDSIQRSWTRRLFRLADPASGAGSLRHAALLQEGGWRLRFSTRMVAAALADHARIMCYPERHPARRDIVRVDPFIPGLPLTIWPAAVHAWQQEMGVPDIRQTDLFTGLDRDSREARKAASEAYKLRFLKPAVAAWEEQEWWALERAKDASKEWPYLGFDEGPRVWALELGAAADHPRFWHWYAAWVLARISGRVPLGAVSDDSSVDALATCPSCGRAGADLRHLLAQCPGTARLVRAAGLEAVRSDWGALCRALFGPCGEPSARAAHVRLVGQLADAICGRPPPRGAAGEGRAEEQEDEIDE